MYLFGPYLLSITPLAYSSPSTRQTGLAILWGCWLLIPGNLFLYGINDLHDEATDAQNAKKDGYELRLTKETRAWVKHAVLASIVSGIALAGLSSLLLPQASPWLLLGGLGLLLLGGQYSAPPLRLKARPFFDSASNSLYIFPVFLAWGLRLMPTPFPWELFLAGGCWCAAMHAFSAIPDIRADHATGLKTIATTLGAGGTLLVCTLLYGTSTLLASPWLGLMTPVLATVYLGLMLSTWTIRHNEQQLFTIYKSFPWINTAIGFGLWVMVVWAYRS